MIVSLWLLSRMILISFGFFFIYGLLLTSIDKH